MAKKKPAKKSKKMSWKKYVGMVIQENKKFYMIIGSFVVVAIVLGLLRMFFLRGPCKLQLNPETTKKVQSVELNYKLK